MADMMEMVVPTVAMPPKKLRQIVKNLRGTGTVARITSRNARRTRLCNKQSWRLCLSSLQIADVISKCFSMSTVPRRNWIGLLGSHLPPRERRTTHPWRSGTVRSRRATTKRRAEEIDWTSCQTASECKIFCRILFWIPAADFEFGNNRSDWNGLKSKRFFLWWSRHVDHNLFSSCFELAFHSGGYFLWRWASSGFNNNLLGRYWCIYLFK